MSKNNIIIYHLYQTSRWEQIFCEQIGALQISGLLDEAKIIISVNGAATIPCIKNCEVVRQRDNLGEKQSLLIAHEKAKANKDARIFYFHSKGISHPTKNQDDWRMMMQHYLIVNWRMAIDYLKTYDVATVNWRTHPCPHPSGNFWWANADFIQSLDSSFLSSSDRTTHEFWLGSNSARIANLHETELDHYNMECPSCFYTHSYFNQGNKNTHVLSYESRQAAIAKGELKPIFNVDYF